MMTPDTPVQYLKGVGEKRSKAYAKLGIHTVSDLLLHFPRDYIDLTEPKKIEDIAPDEWVVVKAVVVKKGHEQHIRKGLSVFKFVIADDTTTMKLTIFNSKYLADSLQWEQEYFFYGKVEGSARGKEFNTPMVFSVSQPDLVVPIYPQTAGLGSGIIRQNIKKALEEIPSVLDPIEEKYRLRYQIPERNASLKNIHFPSSLHAAYVARERFVFEELVTLSCAMSMIHTQTEQKKSTPMKRVLMDSFYRSLAFQLTSAQQRVIEQALNDLTTEIPMNRLVQGDVGSGKTMVAAACIWMTVQNNQQSAMMVPTEILAEQHYASLQKIFEPFGIEISLLTASVKGKEKKALLQKIASGQMLVVVGTHALLSQGVDFQSLGLVITDEQHRFGVAQRVVLAQKGQNANVLVMSATPIPRTLSLIIYGDLVLSTIDELPPGRQPITTLVIDSQKRQRAFGFIREQLDQGYQAYVVCPQIEVGEVDMNLQSAVELAEELSNTVFQNYHVGLLHGKMKPKEKEDIMRRFKLGEIQILVSTTVVEVGVDVPNATIMYIENAERFGLSQLHQLRGRVGRGKAASWCILVSDSKGETARKRLRAMKEIADGFRLSEYDLKLRGPGDFFGSRQHGLPALRIADFAQDLEVLKRAQECAAEILKEDETLQNPQHKLLREEVDSMLESVGDRPN